MQMKRIYVTDFDGTITMKDTNDALADAFAPPNWREIDEKWSRGEISTEEAMEEIFSMIEATEDEMREFFQSLEIDPTFLDFVKWAEERKEPIYIISDGIDFSIDIMLKKYHLTHLPYWSNRLSFIDGKKTIISPKERLEGCIYGTCKCSVLEKLKRDHEGAQVIFIGDGYSDACVAPKADMIFGKGVLAEYLRKHKIGFFPFKDFGDIINAIEK